MKLIDRLDELRQAQLLPGTPYPRHDYPEQYLKGLYRAYPAMRDVVLAASAVMEFANESPGDWDVENEQYRNFERLGKALWKLRQLGE